jgi:hypothetical protein
MKKYVLLLCILLIISSCKKEAGKYCPLITVSSTVHLVDLSPISSIKEIMDTLNKYPQLQPYRVNFARAVYDSSIYYANVSCYVYYRDLIIFNEGYSLHATNASFEPPQAFGSIPTAINISIDPAITLKQANLIAEDTIHFEHCTVSQLGLSNISTSLMPSYRLVWHVSGAEAGYPVVEIDAQTGRVNFIDDGKRY